jgi:hypothetical protein
MLADSPIKQLTKTTDRELAHNKEGITETSFKQTAY